MNGASAEQIILEVGKSPELVSAFRLVAEAEYMGEPRYPPQICRDLAKIVACRNYASALLELCHMVVMAKEFGGRAGWEGFFWADGLARSRIFRARIVQALRRRPADAVFKAGEGAIEIRYPDGAFTIAYGRMPFLAALVEFLVTTLGYDAVGEAMRGLEEGGRTRKSVSLVANALARKVYDYLKDHLPTAQNQRKFRRLIAFLEERFGAVFDVGAIDDGAVLGFWLRESIAPASDGLDFKTFVAVFRAFVRLRQSLDMAKDKAALDSPLHIGSDREAGEVDPGDVQNLVETIEEYRNPLSALESPPGSAVKFLNKRELGDVALLLETGTDALALPLSLMRCEVFGRTQSQITQGLRRKIEAGELQRLIDDCGSENYEARCRALQGLSQHIERVLLATIHALARCRNRQALGVLVALRPSLDLTPLADILGLDREFSENVVMLRADSVSDRFLVLLEDAERAGPELSALMADSRKAFRAVSRQGFQDADLSDPEVEEGHVVGAKALLEVRQRVAAFLERLDSISLPESDWNQQFAADLSVFVRQFEILYGGSR